MDHIAGATLRFEREAAGITAKRLAAQMGVRHETVSRWENRGTTAGKAERYRRALRDIAQTPEAA